MNNVDKNVLSNKEERIYLDETRDNFRKNMHKSLIFKYMYYLNTFQAIKLTIVSCVSVSTFTINA